ncbi:MULTISPECIES: class I SAM-dependent methyltransferase [unclassified Modicisalibacter]|uniref:class I SAM-dependent methyltransferase n=1 Tax=unclassified Modicisalibacter TaxID=2679913 RepID=UPI001CCE5D1C|nr:MULTISPECIES: class I SAM-dependent methyltransferase [unclassified Modicisalibacter]MBZ9556781.1 class I SAM-dependent methyltransferase [Modicisalibacter sp. R2A 31.J]MBZ9574750.1 class I SAM-dependent methyltransferase [Modicisalibacter sp. MOD 31.J]
MKQNIYDEPEFFNGYMALRADESGLNVSIEEPAVRALLPKLNGLDILDIGCGFGKFAGYCLSQDISRFVGLDISEKMIAEAERQHQDERLSFNVGAIEDAKIEEAMFDVAVSSMCLHYVKDLDAVLGKIASALRPGGRLIVSVEHPICTSLLAGWYDSEHTSRLHWPVDNYFDQGVRYANWFVDGVIKYHRTIETYVSAALTAELTIADLLEPEPTEVALTAQPWLAEHVRRPPILVMACDKKP